MPEGGGGDCLASGLGAKEASSRMCPCWARAALLEWKAVQESFKGRRILFPGGINFAGSQFVFAGYSGAGILQLARSTCGSGLPAERSGWGRSLRTDCDIPRPQPCLTTWGRISGKSRSSSGTRISAPQDAIPTSDMRRPGRLRRHSAGLWSETGRGRPSNNGSSHAL